MDGAIADRRIKSSFPNGTFNTTGSQDRLNTAKLSALQTIFTSHDWDFKIKTATINTTAGNTGPYALQTDLVRFANIIRNYKWATDETDRIVPIRADSGSPYELYFYVKDGSLYFREDPGTLTLDIYYRGAFDNDPDNLAITEALVDPDLMGAYIHLTIAELKLMIPDQMNDSEYRMNKGMKMISDYWEDYSKDLYSHKISPRGTNGILYEDIAEAPNLYSNKRNTFENRY